MVVEVSPERGPYSPGAGAPSFGKRINQTADIDFLASVQAGLIRGWRVVEVFGEFDGGQGGGMPAGLTDVWMSNLLGGPARPHSPDPAGEIMRLVSTDAADGPAGIGCRRTRVSFIDPDGFAQVEEVELDGLNPVDTGLPMRFVNTFEVCAAGTHGAAIGNIALYDSAGDIANDLYSMIAENTTKDLSTDRMVPANTRFLLQGWHAEESNGKEATFHLWSSDVAGVFTPGIYNSKSCVRLKNSSSGMLHASSVIPAGSIGKISADAKTPGSAGSAGWWGYLIDDIPTV